MKRGCEPGWMEMCKVTTGLGQCLVRFIADSLGWCSKAATFSLGQHWDFFTLTTNSF